MRVDMLGRTLRRVTVWHRPDIDGDEWEATAHDGTWQAASVGQGVGSDATLTPSDYVTVQIPGDERPEVSKGDYVSLGDGCDGFAGTTAEMRDALPDGALRVSSVADRTGGVGHAHGIMRLASCVVVTAQ